MNWLVGYLFLVAYARKRLAVFGPPPSWVYVNHSNCYRGIQSLNYS